MNTPLSPLRRGARTTAVTAVTAAILLLATGLSGCASSASSTAHAAEPATAGLHLIENDGHRIAFHVTAGSLPAIVLDAGGGADSGYWKTLVPALSAATGSEIITYDREGMGLSDAVTGAYSMKEEASDLHTGLRRLGIAGDTVLVSHSEAAEVATGLVDVHPHDITGAVLVDPSLPEFYTDSEIARIVAANTPQVAQLQQKKNPTAAERQFIAIAENYAPEHAAYHRMTWPASVPATVIASASTPFPTAHDADAWRHALSTFVAKAANRQLVAAPGTSHDVPLDAPRLVIKQIQAMLKSVG